MFCAASVAPPAVADGDLPMLAFLSFPVSSLLMCAAAIRRTGFFVFHGIPNPAFSALPTLCFHHFLIFFLIFQHPPCLRRVHGSSLFSRAALGSARGCKGRSPLHEITLGSPFPGGEGGRGDGGKNKAKGRVGGRQSRQAPRRVSQRQGRTAARKASPPPGTCMAGAVRAANGLIPGCRGRSPRQNKLIVSPFPGGEGGGGMGAKSKLKSGAAGNPKGKPPLWIPEWHGQPATSRAPPRLAPQRQAEPATARHISPPQ